MSKKNLLEFAEKYAGKVGCRDCIDTHKAFKKPIPCGSENGDLNYCIHLPKIDDSNLMAWAIYNEVYDQTLPNGALNLLTLISVIDEHGFEGETRADIYHDVQAIFGIIKQSYHVQAEKNQNKNMLENHKTKFRH